MHRISPRDLLLIISGRVAVKMLLTEATLDLLGEKLTCRSATNLIYLPFLLIFLIAIAAPGGVPPFIYFQF